MVFPLSLEIGRSHRWEFISLHSQKEFMGGLILVSEFGVSQAAESLRFQMIKTVLRLWKLRYSCVLTCFVNCP